MSNWDTQYASREKFTKDEPDFKHNLDDKAAAKQLKLGRDAAQSVIDSGVLGGKKADYFVAIAGATDDPPRISLSVTLKKVKEA